MMVIFYRKKSMEPITRQEARSKNMISFYTGRPCKHGHDTYRYTSSGTCAGCVAACRPTARIKAVRNPNTPSAQELLVSINLRAYPEDVQVLKDTAAALCLARHPGLHPLELRTKTAPFRIEGRTALYKVLVPAEDVAAMRAMVDAFIHAHCVDTNAIKADLLNDTVSAAPRPLPDWLDRP